VTVGSVARPSGQVPGAITLGVSATALLLIVFMLVAGLAVIGHTSLGVGNVGLADGSSDDASTLAQREIPPQYLRLYEEAARRYGLDWAILAAIGKVECDHGRDPDPSCSREGAVNSAGAGGPMQFIASTWARYGVDGDGDGRIDRWDPADAIFSAANYLRASGAPGDYRRAIFAYNHAGWYVADVERWAALYRGSELSARVLAGGEGDREQEGEAAGEGAGLAGADMRLQRESPTPVVFVAGEHAVLAPGDGHLALVPSGVPATVQAMVVAGNELQGLPYGPGGHPDPRGAFEEDCSSTVNYVLYRSGVREIGEIVRDNPLAQDYVHWGLPGPGRWVTIYATASPTNHVFIVIAGLRLDTSHDGTDVGPNRNEDGPRWRILDYIPTWARWSVRHPPGL
jgi:Transglycosylase SLT domain